MKILSAAILIANFTLLNGAARIQSDTLAVIGKRVITADEFEQLYKNKLHSVGMTDNGDIRMKYLQNLVDDEILIEHAKRIGLDKTKKSQAELKRIQQQELLDVYVVKHITDSVTIVENDLKKFYTALNTKIKVRHLYAKTKEEAEALYRQLMEGKTFAQIAQKIFTDPVLKNCGGDLGYISVDEMDPEFEKVAFALKVGEVSKPVKTVQGYSIIQVEDKIVNPLLTETEFAKSKERLYGFVRKRKIEEAAKNYSAALRKKIKITFNRSLIEKLFATTRIQPAEHLMENPSKLLSSKDLNTIAVTSAIHSWSLNELIELVSTASESQRKWIKTVENFEDYIAGLIMRRQIEKMAKKEKLDSTLHYTQSVQRNYDTYLLMTIEEQLKNQISFARDSLQAYYIQHQQDFMKPREVRLSGILIELKDIADSIKVFLTNGISFEETAREYSVQSQTAVNGGDLGFFSMKDLAELGDDVTRLHEGEWCGPLVDNGKYLFLKCTEIKNPAYRQFEDCAVEIEVMLKTSAWYKNKNAMIESLKKEIHCVVYPEKAVTISLSLSN